MPLISLRPITVSERETVISILLDADEDEARVRAFVNDERHTTYAAFDGTMLVGAAAMRWGQESEIEYIAVVAEHRGKGYGKAIIAALLAEARQRTVQTMLVGTDNTAFETIAFYQKCGFRMDHVRRDFFHYIQPPIIRDGIPLCDMLVLRYEVR